ncbi:MBL fold metallo-hydrolase [Phyllobacterium sp. P30BS-XVII]|uniref:MBL fold metallo-hydrolase RNA specificity domain-containing protein n=1 Tax=Phyllobacterium sp. P30BS-XVII TaxID=2587046 RepID=UPI000DDD5986|nr:MBL fold metallo-hydrolase [Phyllobacterium sp. P30BS-XVII]MBA8903150.1 metallo-beta-lactamase family protein [Phyllobacterium sp. P30BS-XVII]
MSLPRLHFHGAAHSVTGSCFEIETEKARVLVDCGMFQGPKSERELNYRAFPFDPEKVDAVLLTHAHIDHSGLLPKLVNKGFTGRIFATKATIDLCSVMLPDSAHIQETEVEQLNRRNAQRGRPIVTPIYIQADATACMPLFRSVDYREWISIVPGIRARFWNAGHLLGSASIEIELASEESGPILRLMFSGDIGPAHKLLQSSAEGPRDLDYLVCEATYGDRERGDVSSDQRREILLQEVQMAVRANGPLVIPSFAVERTQELLVDLFLLMKAGSIPASAIFVDSPLATRASEIFERHASEIERGDILRDALNDPHVRFTETVEQSKSINRISGFFVVIAASGMCDAGRIRHHLKANLWRKNATILLTGYQAQGSLGRILLDHASSVRIQGEEVQVKARVRQLDLYSGHADASELMNWIQARNPVWQHIFLVHGEEGSLDALKNRLETLHDGAHIVTPELDDTYELGQTATRLVTNHFPRLPPNKVAHLDWHNDLSKLLLDISEAVDKEADERGRSVIIRGLREALDNPKNPRS